MPRYDYRCNDCGEQFEVVQSFDEPTLTACPHCGEQGLRKLFGNVGVVFKGSGFYRNDSRESDKKSPAATGESSASKSEAASSSDAAGSTSDTAGTKTDKATTKSESQKPAAAKSSGSAGSSTNS
ncbi:MAG: FmdB family transcriptional regulator [Actinomycetia bacterium]|nr:FmdB family transcriptional regulator [Actinomycetes bacterium]MCH9801556.1 FmdB family transcriptional regulator [Actinomycetes bacterium]